MEVHVSVFFQWPNHQARLKLPVLSTCHFYFGRRKRGKVEVRERSPLPKYFHLSWILISKIIPVQCHWQQELCMRENIKFSLGWSKPGNLSWVRFVCFISSLAYRWKPAWSRIGLCYRLDIHTCWAGASCSHCVLVCQRKVGIVEKLFGKCSCFVGFQYRCLQCGYLHHSAFGNWTNTLGLVKNEFVSFIDCTRTYFITLLAKPSNWLKLWRTTFCENL